MRLVVDDDDPGANTLTFESQHAIGCPLGWQVVPGSSEYLKCLNTSANLEAEVNWTGSVQCVRNWCPTRPTDPYGVFRCSKSEFDGISVFEDVCKLSCNQGYQIRNGDGIYV